MLDGAKRPRLDIVGADAVDEALPHVPLVTKQKQELEQEPEDVNQEQFPRQEVDRQYQPDLKFDLEDVNKEQEPEAGNQEQLPHQEVDCQYQPYLLEFDLDFDFEDGNQEQEPEDVEQEQEPEDGNQEQLPRQEVDCQYPLYLELDLDQVLDRDIVALLPNDEHHDQVEDQLDTAAFEAMQAIDLHPFPIVAVNQTPYREVVYMPDSEIITKWVNVDAATEGFLEDCGHEVKKWLLE